MTDLDRFTAACATLLALTAAIRFGADIARCLAARALAAAFRRVVREERVRGVWTVDRDGRVRTDARRVELRARKGRR